MKKRIPRITGTTSQAIHIRGEQDEETRKKKTRALQKYVLSEYTRNGLRLNGEQVTLQDLA